MEVNTHTHNQKNMSVIGADQLAGNAVLSPQVQGKRTKDAIVAMAATSWKGSGKKKTKPI